MTAELLDRLPNLKLIASTGAGNAAIDGEAVKRRGIEVLHTGYNSNPTIEFTWALILALVRNVATENASLRGGGWQIAVGADLFGKTLGIVGLGNIGSRVAEIGNAFGMKVVAWSQNLTRETADALGVELVGKDVLFQRADVVTVHLVLSDRTRGIVGKRELALMKPTAFLINTARGPVVDEQALIDALRRSVIAGAGLDVFDEEPLPVDHPLRRLENALLTPHLGYVTVENYREAYGQAVENIQAFLAGNPVRVIA